MRGCVRQPLRTKPHGEGSAHGNEMLAQPCQQPGRGDGDKHAHHVQLHLAIFREKYPCGAPAINNGKCWVAKNAMNVSQCGEAVEPLRDKKRAESRDMVMAFDQ